MEWVAIACPVYASVALALAWLPGFAAHTAFNPLDLSRVVISPLTPVGTLETVSTMLLGCALLVAMAALWLGWRGRARRSLSRLPDEASATADERHWRAGQALALGVTLVTLAFVLTFRALPAHYLLDFLPLASLLWLGSRRRTVLWLAALMAVGALGQVLVDPSMWRSLVALHPAPVALLVARNLAWIAAAGVLLAALWHDARKGGAWEGASGAP